MHGTPTARRAANLVRWFEFERLVQVEDQIAYVLRGVFELFLRKLALMSDERFL